MKIIVLPFAGGNCYSFKVLKSFFDNKGIFFKVLEYPGRGERIEEQLSESINDIVNDIYNKLSGIINKNDRYIIYGHSMGGLIAYLVCQRIELLQKLPKPIKLVVSGNGAPSINKEEKIAYLPSKLFWNRISEFGGFPQEIINNKALRDFFEPVLRADFKVVEGYGYEDMGVLTIPIDVIYGSEENIRQKILPWKKESTKEVTFTELKGNHFFIYNHIDFFTDLFIDNFGFILNN